jgi:hypothetical protein
MTGELRTILFHVRRRLIQVRETLLQDDAEAATRPMTIDQAVGYLTQAINLELARPLTAGKTPINNTTRADRARKVLANHVEARGETLNTTNRRGQISELIADLLHLAATFDRNPDSVDSILRRSRAIFERDHGVSKKE